ncbi:hypothetical protein ACIQNU_39475 [Streptomyces sp. NPDC091292]|uniref:hypothetical protein n=1 Tax=Streptomyces sp. NPDC091292 TaxID=3365991 RepID=UPI003824A057
MPMRRGTFDNAPLTTLFPDLSLADVHSLQSAASAVDRASANRTEWEWALQLVVFHDSEPGSPVILGVDVIEHADGTDRLEFLLQVVWTEKGQLAVDAAVNVACWCDSEHATHDIDAVRVVVDDETSLVNAFRASAERLTGWLADPRDADHWRARAGLPVRRPE